MLETTKGQKGLPRYFAAAFNMVKSMDFGGLEVALPDGRIFKAQGKQAGPQARLDVQNGDIFARLIRDGNTAFSDGYLEGWWSTPDLQAFMDLVHANHAAFVRSFPGGGVVKVVEKIRHWMNANTRRQAKKNISYHYDLGNDFYTEWLDETMTYSSALFETGQENMEKAQIQKYASICDQMGMKEGDHLLEIGCGWGGFAEYAAGIRGAKMTCLTISQEQHDFARDRMKRKGLQDRVEIVLRDYRDETGVYDGIASIEMFEAVGERFWPSYFDTLRDRLKPGKQATLQIITISDEYFPKYRKSVDFIQKHIFPGGMLPSPTALREQIRRANLEFRDSVDFGKSYSLTLRRWFETFNEKWGKIESMGFDDRFKRMWDYYLASCAAGFEYGPTDVVQVTLRKPC
ncbi:MAG: cyclopropane-fatty-acyl-phospholipid synthase family protein [Pseudomonadota bacterium]